MLTRRQTDLYKFIASHIAETGVAPTYATMLRAMGLASKSGVARLVDALVERGFLNRMPLRAQAIELTGKRLPESFTVKAAANDRSAAPGVVLIPLYKLSDLERAARS